MQFYSSLEISGNLNRNSSLNGKCAIFPSFQNRQRIAKFTWSSKALSPRTGMTFVTCFGGVSQTTVISARAGYCNWKLPEFTAAWNNRRDLNNFTSFREDSRNRGKHPKLQLGRRRHKRDGQEYMSFVAEYRSANKAVSNVTRNITNLPSYFLVLFIFLKMQGEMTNFYFMFFHCQFTKCNLHVRLKVCYANYHYSQKLCEAFFYLQLATYSEERLLFSANLREAV